VNILTVVVTKNKNKKFRQFTKNTFSLIVISFQQKEIIYIVKIICFFNESSKPFGN